MADSIHQYGQIYIGSRGGVNQGVLKISNAGFMWKRMNGGKTLEIKKDDLTGLIWTKNSRGCQLGVHTKEGPTTNFLGFREKDLEALRDLSVKQFGCEIQEQPMATTGRNWGGVAINGGSLMFTVDGKVAFEIPLRDVSQAQQMKDDIMMEFHADDTAGDDKEDCLTEMAFHIPPGHPDFAGLSGEDPAAKVLLDQVLQHTDAGAATTDDAVCIFGDVAVLAPRGRFEVQMHLGFLSLVGQTQDFKIRYTSIQRIFILPKSNTPHTLVVISLDPPIRKGQTYYTHVLCQFPSQEEETIELDITPEQLAAKNEKCGGKLEASLTGMVHDVFARALRGLSGAKITKPGAFRNAAADGHSIRCSYKADDGHLYPLERAFFYVHKPPMLVPFEDIESVEFARQGGGVVSSRTFDLVVRMKNSEAEHQFRNIQRTEWQNLFEFINAKKIRVENLASAQQGPGGPGKALDIDDDIDPGLRRAELEVDTDEDDEDFEAGGSGGSSDDDESDEEDSSDAEMIAEEGITVDKIQKVQKTKKRERDGEGAEGASPVEKPAPKKSKPDGDEAKKPAKPREPKAPKAPKTEGEGGAAGGGKEKKPRKKKDPNAPKKGLSAFMYFSNEMRNKVKEENPGIAFGEVGKLLGERWKALPAEQKVKFEQMAEKDKERYTREMAAYKAGSGGAAAEDEGGDDEAGSEGGDE
mmetsp:Transcript_4974/g.10722  ORF Transcript_4974/g.10722 Transcript_4974/m.10722 type:complete len:694 (-) Transcript_4974:634-2715(-)|eukprot:CAMPEP_0202898476 /NCGR_PEP_ID=MMETSP1392-20130828/6996_1 /ASSEMBLY_ACC=CAM_ASM_000868 /TAXON_ID=225041 /ORGANISM="Chlamydomonas chlamydogama, Strain SAG 11-48b" /LENGTH=693 /DNA_ID=CAMNT_0049584419 /DNA_START=219 /DNA_END=2300 /DNA_ORIENTATION=+